jgi:hypothetical protein
MKMKEALRLLKAEAAAIFADFLDRPVRDDLLTVT